MKHKVIKILVLAIAVSALLLGGYFANRYLGERYARKQVTHILDNDYGAIYEGLDAKTKALYSDNRDFAFSFGTSVLPVLAKGGGATIEKVQLASRYTESDAVVYTYRLIRKDDFTKGFTVRVRINKDLFIPKTKEVHVQLDNFETVVEIAK